MLASGKDGDVYISEEEREGHTHIVGTTGQGKSKFLEYLLRHDIDRLHEESLKDINPREGHACGLTFIDPSPNAGTIKRVLKYCAKIGFNRIVIVDPLQYRIHKKVIPLNPFNYHPSQIEDSVASMQDIFKVLFGITNQADTSFVNRYGYHLFNVLHRAKMTLYDAKWWTDRDDIVYWKKRQFIYDKLANDHEAEDSIIQLESVFANDNRYKSFISTIGRVSVLFESKPLELMFSHRDSVDFQALIAGGWVVLVNVSEPLGELPSRLLATTVINQVIQSIEYLRGHGFDKPYYLYIDEAGKYATRKIASIVDEKRQTGLRLILSHQYPGQFEDARIRNSIEINTNIKAAFYIRSSDERAKVIRMLGYGGELSDRDVNFALSSMPRQEMVLGLGKKLPQVTKALTIPDADGDPDELIKALLQSESYYTEEKIKQDYADRFKGIDSVEFGGRIKPNNRAASHSPGRKAQHPAKSATGTGTKRTAGKAEVRGVDALFLEAEELKKTGRTKL